MSPANADEQPNGQRRPSGESRSADPKNEPGVLSSLPSTRPQRPSARRAAARRTTAERAERAVPAKPGPSTAAGTKPAATVAAKPTAQSHAEPPAEARAKPAAKATAKPAAEGRRGQAKRTPSKPATPRRRRASGTTSERPPLKPAEPAVPRQGYEAEEEIAPGHSVQPPSGTELAASVAELLGELAQAGLSAGGRLLKDALAHLPRG